tara:strand:+ start:4183 stop:5448 length:1266 start_codon:yes stop_codon:yes gene_type:complete
MRKRNPNLDKKLPSRKFIKTPGRQIRVQTELVSPIKSATSIKSSDLHSDKEFVLRDKFEFEIDKKNERSDTGIIISKEGVDDWKLEIASARFIFDRDLTERFNNVEFEELDKAEKPNYAAPIIDQFEYENVTYHEANKDIKGARKLAYNLGETHVLSSWANGTPVLVCNAYNYEDKRGEKNRELLQFTWYFSADINRNFNTDVQQKVIGKGRKLILNDVQRSAVGRYFCEISNDKGVTRSMVHYLNAYRDGRIVELMGGEKENIPLGRYEWQDISTTKGFDRRHPKLSPYKDYLLEEEKWVRMVYNSEIKAYENTDIVRANKSPGRRPWNTNKTIQWVKKNSMKGNTVESSRQRKQGYWKYNNSTTVYWSDSQDVYSFPDPPVYYDHREEMGYKRDFSDIEVFNRSQNNPYLLDDDTVKAY